jgi:branched-chain amino acid transport system ATP-binding protein
MRGELKVENIYAGYGKKEILRGITFSLNKEEIVVLIGPNGAGKSTLLKVIAGVLKPYKGRIIWNDTDITSLPPYKRNSLGITYFIQGGRVFPNLTVMENFKISMAEGKNKNKLDEVFNLFPELKNLLGKRAGLLSGGQKQQVAIAMVLLKEPKIILFDEPSAGLSPNLASETISKIKLINNLWNTSIVLVEQNVSEALKIANKVYIMSNGQIIYGTDKSEEILKDNLLEKLFFGINT